MVTPLKTWQGPFNIRAEGLEAETSQKSTFLREWGQRLEMTPVDLGNKSVKKLGVYQVLRLEVKPCHWDWVRHNRERRYFQERPGFSQVQGKKQNTFLRVSHNGDRQKIRKKKKRGKMLISLLQTRSVERFMWFCYGLRPVPSFCSSKGMEGSTQKENNTSWFHVLLERSPGWIEFTWSTGVRHWKYLRICYIQIWQGDGGRMYVS